MRNVSVLETNRADFTPSSVRFADIDGAGLADLLYIPQNGEEPGSRKAVQDYLASLCTPAMAH